MEVEEATQEGEKGRGVLSLMPHYDQLVRWVREEGWAITINALPPELGGHSISAHCESPKYSSTTFSTTDAFFHFSTTYIVEFTLQCANNPKDMAIYGTVNGKAYQAAVLEETSKHQISWQLDHEQSGAQTFNVNIYDEDGYASFRKAERNSEDPNKVKPLFTIEFKHPGVSKASPIASETVVTLVALAWLYIAYSFKSQLLA
ncbi:unnamed protein product [Anisakis simplex]|uniref:Translocon-associated protein subunit delta n=1 Tax=Anisakis simplex TaxID=6269 RepID=A0A0M3JSK0_ANISI|nr:unnamed protein product [Anisakis simplex]